MNEYESVNVVCKERIKDIIRVSCIHYNNDNSLVCRIREFYNGEESNCIKMFGRLTDRREICSNFTLDWVKFLLYKKHLMEIKE